MLIARRIFTMSLKNIKLSLQYDCIVKKTDEFFFFTDLIYRADEVSLCFSHLTIRYVYVIKITNVTIVDS